MKKLFIFGALLSMLFIVASCQDEKKVAVVSDTSKADSLQSIIEQKDNEINDMMATFNEIQEGFRQIAEAENRVSVAKDGERTDKAQQIRENMQFIATTMKHNRELIEKLRQQLHDSSVKGEELQTTIEGLVKQLEDKNKELQQLRAELDAKDIHIGKLDETITTLNTRVNEVTAESDRKTETIHSQDIQLNTAWYVFGTKKELREQRIMEGDKVLQANFNKSYFTKIDIREVKEIKLYSKSATLKTTHPSSSYTLQQDANKQYVLRITNPQLFWSTSKYLVIVVK